MDEHGLLPPLLLPPIDMQEVDVFTLSVLATTSRQYRKLMSRRDHRKVNLSPRVIQGVATTPATSRYYIIRLVFPGKDDELWLLFNHKNEYLLAFRNAQGIWFQFFDQEVPANFNPRRLRLKGSHIDMPAGPKEHTTVGRFTVREVYSTLINFGGLYGKQERRMLHASTIIFSEASRYKTIRRLVCFNMDHGINTELTSLMWDKILCWERLSSYVLHSWQLMENDQGSAPIGQALAAIGVTSFRDAVSDLTLMLYDATFF